MKKIKEIIVVEGKSDTLAIKRSVLADTIETNGSEISIDTLNRIKRAHETRGIIVFTDPDFPGKRIREIISEYVPGCKHAYLEKADAIAKGDKGVGVEHASREAIVEALEHVREELLEVEDEMISWEDLMAAGLTGGPDSKHRREVIGRELRLGYMNAKQLHKRLNMFRVTPEEFEQALKALYSNEEE
ncbi:MULTISPECIES: ribonuclease M5 [Fictibacillus]|jgi:ribonuclease M5|uniref:ribonuclease M5 n=1 Tax=Fictibacillus TaxID=1329200 RepID=UPI0018CD8FF9|nr:MULTISPECIES: ribonuclease M5 [unclassified Fictibacillus]MBH0159013.1 ribonuclease M5 [Fictibacillus sp. 5RED26]MBH0163136.1 ribonuclease M5 [Fictibacillus sp. 26RED30]MBH0167507.1 ribonuclease M5 [Fictibacillus sp. 7GRE50]MBH0176125.1 ribonuclease M5 [Fictibacillus sp. 23RED33]